MGSMNSLFKCIDILCENYEKSGSYEGLCHNALKAIIIIRIKNMHHDYMKVCNTIGIDAKEILTSEVFRFLNSEVEKSVWELEEVISISYEYLIKKKAKQSQYGIYYTPQWIVKYIVDNTFKKSISHMDNIKDIRILEPACGSGMFMIYIFDVLYDWYVNNSKLDKEEIVKQILENHLHGIDIDEEGLKICRIRLILKSIEVLRDTPKFKFKLNLLNGDYLRLENSKIQAFDFILGNPPYLENRRINRHFDKEYLKKSFKSAVGRFDVYSLFIEKSIEMITADGHIGFILPGNLLSNNNFTEIRKIILRETDILQLINLGEKVFDNVDMNMAIILLSRRKLANNKIICKNISKSCEKSVDIRQDTYKKIIKQSYYKTTLGNVFDIDSSEKTFRLREKILHHNYGKIKDYCEVIAGIATGNIKDKLVLRDKVDHRAKKLLVGKDINEYSYQWSGLYILDDKSIIDRNNGEYATFMRKEFIYGEKILIRQTADRFICTYDDENYHILNTLYSLVVRKDFQEKISIKYILGFLNSKFNNYLYKTLVRESGKLFPQLKIYHIQNSPIKIAENKLQKDVVEIVDSIINNHRILKNISSPKDRHQILLNNIILKEKLDNMFYEIFNLTKADILEVEREMGRPTDFCLKKSMSNLNC